MAKYSQDQRPLRVDTTLGTDVLLLNGVSGFEGISQLFTFQLDMVSVQGALDPEEVLRTGICVTQELPRGVKRRIHGLASRFTQLGKRDDLVFYRAEIVPWLWFLTLSRESRIYQEQTVPDILAEVFKHVGFSDFELRLTRSYKEREYCVQYRETHFNFVSRLMEEEGIFYFFEHESDKHTLVLSDDSSSSKTAEGAETVRFAMSPHLEDTVWELGRETSVHSRRVTIGDYDYLQPTLSLTTSLGQEEQEEVYDYPGRYRSPEEGERIATLLLEAEEAERQVMRGEGNVRGLAPGFHFSLEEHFNKATDGDYLVTSVHHDAKVGDYRAWDNTEGMEYRCDFLAIPHKTPYRPRRSTARPIASGSQSALVVGPANEELYVDKHGRVKVQFYWDRDGKRDDKSSCWIRVATPWGGGGYGSVSIPRIGNEVMVSFEDGDPDRPIIIGSVYNADQTPPFELPGAGIQMGMKSRSSKGGGGMNEITVTDTKGKEQITIHGQYDMSTAVEHDQSGTVGNNRTTAVAVDDSESVGSNQELSVGANQTTSVGGDRSMTVSGNQTADVGGNQTLTVGGNEESTVGGNRSASVGGNEETTVGGSQTISVSGSATLTVSGAYTVGADGDIKIDGSANVNVTAGAKITLSAGGSTIEIGPAGITIQSGAIVSVTGAMVKLN
jgi:type VI secretion system secreted protein VgrG